MNFITKVELKLKIFHILQRVLKILIFLNFEWRILPCRFINKEKIQLASLEIDQMWKQILDSKDFNGEKLFPTLEFLIEIIFSLPHSNAEAERIYFQ